MRNRKTLSVIIAFALVLSLFHVMPASAKVKISATKKTLYVGKSTTLKVTGTKKKVKWSSSSKKVATVTQKGKVTAKKKGMATIKAKVAKSTFKCNVTIKDVNNTEPTSTQIPVKEDEIVNINKLLCEDENISVVFKEIKNGKIILAVSNKSNDDFIYGSRYITVNGVTYYDDYIVYDIYSGTKREIELSLYEDYDKEVNYSFTKVVPKGIRTWLEKNKIFFEIFSFVFVGGAGIVISFVGLEFNKTIVDINRKQLEITENDKKPHFYIKCDYLSVDTTKIGVDGKTPKCYYNIVNNGEDITVVSINPESYIFFYVPTDIEQEYYIFKFCSHDFWMDYGRSIGTIEKDKEYQFAEYVIKENYKSEWEEIAKTVSKYFPDIKCVHENIVRISYTDYMGDDKEEFFTFDDRNIKKENDEEWYISIEDDYGIDFDLSEPKPAMQVVKESAEEIRKGIEDWMKDNKGSRGYKIPDDTRFEYIG